MVYYIERLYLDTSLLVMFRGGKICDVFCVVMTLKYQHPMNVGLVPKQKSKIYWNLQRPHP